MNIGQAKQQIKDTITIYLKKDLLGNYVIPLMHQRPVFIQGAPGLGKTAIMKQIAEEMKIGLVSYSMTHHTRQSAIGLPVIVKKEYGGLEYSVSEYTMSEIIASVYDCMQQKKCKEGILFLDEINCISETLLPSMLLFLQYKVFGGHSLPEGWVVVTAGNQKKYNRSAREFDTAIRDRLQWMVVEPEYEVWRKYALEKKVEKVILSYLDVKREHFYVVDSGLQKDSVVTPRGWEDLSVNIHMRERLGMEVDENLVKQYLQDKEVAGEFAIYYEMYQKYRKSFDAETVLSKQYSPDFFQEAKKANLNERIQLVEILLDYLFYQMSECIMEYDGWKIVRRHLKKAEKEETEDETIEEKIVKTSNEIKKNQTSENEKEYQIKLTAIEILERLRHSNKAGFEKKIELRECYQIELQKFKQKVQMIQKQIGNLIDFVEKAYGEGNELSIVLNDLASTPESMAFIGQFLSAEYLKASKEHLLHHREETMLHHLEIG